MAGQTDKRQISMFGNSAEFRDRVKRLRLHRQWDQATLGAKANLSAAMISSIERGRVTPAREQIDAIATAFGYSSDFLTAELDLVPTTRPWLRAYADASKREADARTAGAALATEYIRRLKLKPLPDLIPDFDGAPDDESAIEEAAVELRQLAGLEPDAVIGNAVRAAERLGCVVLPLESELGRHLGMSVRADGMPIICVAKDGVPGDRQRWTVIHEVGHLVLHGHAPPPSNAHEARRMEDQAHRFAAAFLGPGDALIDTLEEVGGKVTLNALADVKSVWGIAIKGLVGRFHALGIIDADHARSLYKQISARKWTTDEPVHVPRESAQWFERTLLRKAESEELSTACDRLAFSIGGNANDLFGFADWVPVEDAEVVSLDDHRQRSN